MWLSSFVPWSMRNLSIEITEVIAQETVGLICCLLEGIQVPTHLDEQPVSGDPLVRLGEQVCQSQALSLVASPPHVLKERKHACRQHQKRGQHCTHFKSYGYRSRHVRIMTIEAVNKQEENSSNVPAARRFF